MFIRVIAKQKKWYKIKLMNINFLKFKNQVELLSKNFSEKETDIEEEHISNEKKDRENNEDYVAFNYSDNNISDSNSQETIYKKITRLLVLISVAAIPLFFLPWSTGVLELNKQMFLVIFSGAGLILWLLDVIISGKLSWRFNFLDKGIISFVGAVVLSSLFSKDVFKSIFGGPGGLSESLLTVVSLSVLYFLIVNSFNDKGKKIVLFLSVSLFVAILYGLLQMMGLFIIKLPVVLSKSFNTLGSVNTLGIVSAIFLPLFFNYNLDKKIFKYLIKLGAFAALAVLIVINWWVLWAVAITGMVSLVVFENLVADRKGFKISRFVFPMTVIVLGIFVMLVSLNLVFIKKNLPVEVAPSHSLSLKIAWKTLKESPVFGYGPENFSLAFDKYGAQELRNSTFLGVKFFDSTSFILNTMINNGLVGIVALGFLLWLVFWSLFKIIKSKTNLDSEGVGIVSSVLAAIVAIFLYPFNLVLLFLFYLLLALFVLSVLNSRKVTYNIEERSLLSIISSLGFVGGLILALVGFYFSLFNYVADIKYAQALKAKEPKDGIEYVVQAINWNNNDDRFYRLASQLALALLSKELNSNTNQKDDDVKNKLQNYLSSSVSLAQRATQVAPNEVLNWSNLGDIYQNLTQLVQGTDNLAENAYLKAAELRPGDPTFYNKIGSMYIFKSELLRQLALRGGNSASQFNQQSSSALLKAEDAFKKAIELSNNFGLAIYNLGLVYERQGKINEAIKQLETLMPFNSDQPGLAFELGLLYYRANRKNDALAQFEKAVVLFPNYANARWYLALIYEERKELDRAIEQLERILSIEANKDNETVLSKLKDLREGKVSIPPGKVLDQKPL
jgi:tetratricopeptide (TPR) repeat protein